MKYLIPYALLAALPAFSQSGDCSKVFQTSQAAGGNVSMTLRAGDIDVVGTKNSVIRVTCDLSDRVDASKVKISFAAGRLRVQGGPNNGVKYRVELPEKTSVLIRATAGDMHVTGLIGDKDIELNAGDLIVEVGDPKLYKVAEGKVMAGNISARPFGSQKDGLFRSFRKDSSSGQYRLRAELMAGDLTLK